MKSFKILLVIAGLLLALPGALHAEDSSLIAANMKGAAGKTGVITVIGCWYGPGSAADADDMFFTHDDKEVSMSNLGMDIKRHIIDACTISQFPHIKDDTCCKMTFEGYLAKDKKTYKIKRFIKAEKN